MRHLLLTLISGWAVLATLHCNDAATINPPASSFQLFPASCEWYQPVLNSDTELNSPEIIRNTVWLTGDHSGNVGTDGAFPVNTVNNAPLAAKLTFRDGYNCREDYPDSVPSFAGMATQNGEYLNDPNHDTDGAKDHHLVVLDTGTHRLYEFYQPRPKPAGSATWYCEGGVMWDLDKCQQRVSGTTSADAAGLPLLPLLITPQEMATGGIKHALRITVAKTLWEFVSPAVHWAAFKPALSGDYMPMGTRLRLRSNFDTSMYGRDVKVILKCLMVYGAIVADNGTNFSITYVRDDAMQQYGERWGPNGDGSDWHSINLVDRSIPEKRLTAFDFQVVKLGTRYTTTRPPCKP